MQCLHNSIRTNLTQIYKITDVLYISVRGNVRNINIKHRRYKKRTSNFFLRRFECAVLVLEFGEVKHIEVLNISWVVKGS